MQKINLDKYEQINKYLEDLGKKDYNCEQSASTEYLKGVYSGITLCLKILGFKTFQRTVDGVIQLDPECVE